jgi:hypothetical protein
MRAMILVLDLDLLYEKSRDIQWRLCPILQVIEPLILSKVTAMARDRTYRVASQELVQVLVRGQYINMCSEI